MVESHWFVVRLFSSGFGDESERFDFFFLFSGFNELFLVEVF